MNTKSIKSLFKNKKFWGVVSVSAISLAVILLQRKSVTVIEVDGDLVINSDAVETETELAKAE